MTWMGAASEWKQGLGSSALQKIEELEDQVDRLKKERLQKQNQLDVFQQSLEKQKRLVEEETRQKQSLAKELESLGQACKSWEGRNRGKSENHSLFKSHGAEELKRKIDDLESKNRQLESKLCLSTPSKQVCRSNFTGASQSDDFWSHFSSSKRGTSLQQQPSPFKVAAVKKAIETSEENPFKTPLVSCQQDEYLVKPSKEICMSELIPGLNENSAYIKELERKLAASKLELEESKQKTATETVSFSMDTKPTERIDDSKVVQSLHEDLSEYKLKLEQAESKLEEANVRLSSLQNEMNCQRHNNEAARQQLENKCKQRETELLAEAALMTSDFGELNSKMKDLEKKMGQRETLAMANQNSLQSSLDKASAKLASIESEKAYQISSYNKLETKLSTLQKSEEDLTLMLSKMKQEKEMHAAQVDSLKLKHSTAETTLAKVRSQLEFNEQQLHTQKYDLEECNKQKTSFIKERDGLKKDLQDSINNKIQSDEQMKENVNRAEVKLNELKTQFDTVVLEKETSIQKLADTEKNCSLKLESVHKLEDEIADLKENLEKVTSEKNSSIEQLRVQISTEQKLKEDEMSAIRKQCDNDLNEANRKATHVLEESQHETNQELATLNDKIVIFEKKVIDLTSSESKAKQDKLNCEVGMWELEGKLETIKESEEKLKKEIENCKVKLRSAENLITEKDQEATSMSNDIQQMRDTCKEYNLNSSKAQSDLIKTEESLCEVTARYDDQKTKYEEASAKLLDYEIRLTNLREDSAKTVETLSNDVQNAERQSVQAQATLQTNSANYQAQMAHLAEVKSSLDAENIALGEEVASLENEVKSLKEEIDTNTKLHQDELANRETILGSQQDNIAELEEKTIVLAMQLNSMTSTNVQMKEELLSERGASQERFDNLTALGDNLAGNLAEKTNQLAEVEEEMRSLTDLSDSLKRNLAEMTDTKSAEIDALNEKLTQAVVTLESTTSEMSTLRKELGSQHTQNGELLENLRRQEESVSNAELQLRGSQQSNRAITQELATLTRENETLAAKLMAALGSLEATACESNDEFRQLKEFVATALQLAGSQYSTGMDTVLAKHQSMLGRLTTVQISASKLHERVGRNVGHEKELEEKNVQLKVLQIEISDYQSKCTEKDEAADKLHQQVKRGAQRYLELEIELNNLKAAMQISKEKLRTAHAAVHEEKEKSSDHIHSLSQSLSSIKAQLAEKDVILQTISAQCEALELELSQVNCKLAYELDEKRKVEGEYDIYRDAIRIFSVHGESSNDDYECQIKTLQDTLHNLQTTLAFKKGMIKSMQDRDEVLSTELRTLKDSIRKTGETHQIKYNCVLNRKEELDIQCSEMKFELERSSGVSQSMTVALLRLEDLISKLLQIYACHITEVEHMQIGVLEACEDNLISEKMDDMEKMVDFIVEHEDPRQKRELLDKNESLEKRVSHLTDNVKCLEDTLESILNEKKELQAKCDKSNESKANLEQSVSELKQLNSANDIETSQQFHQKINDHQITIDFLNDKITSLENDILTKESEYQSTLWEMQSSHQKLTQHLETATKDQIRLEHECEVLAGVEKELFSSQSDKNELQNQVFAYSEAEKSVLQKIDVLNAGNEEKVRKLDEQKIRMSELETDLESFRNTHTKLFEGLSSCFERLLPKMSTLVQNERDCIGSAEDQVTDIVCFQNKLNFQEKYYDIVKKFIDQPSMDDVDNCIEIVDILERIIETVLEFEITQRAFDNREKEVLNQRINDSRDNCLNLLETNRNMEQTRVEICEESLSLRISCDELERENLAHESILEDMRHKCTSVGISSFSNLVDEYVLVKENCDRRIEEVASLKEIVDLLEEKIKLSKLGSREIAELEADKTRLEQKLIDKSSAISELESRLEEYACKLDGIKKSLQSADENLAVTEGTNSELLQKLKEYLQEEKLLIDKNINLKRENETNSLRVIEDKKIISEMNDRLISTEKQYKQLQECFETIEADNNSFTDTIRVLNTNIDSLNGKLGTAVANEQKNRIELTTLKTETDSKMEKYVITISNLTSKAKVDDLNTLNKLSELNDALTKVNDEKRSLSDKVIELNSSINDLSERFDQAAEESVRLEKEHQLVVHHGEKKIIALTNNLKDSEALCNLKNEELRKLTEESGLLSSTNDSLCDINENLTTTLDKVNEDMQRIKSDFDGIVSAHASKMAGYSIIIDDLKAQAQERDSRREELEVIVNEAKASIKSLQGKLALSCRNLHKMEKQLTKSQAHIDKLNAERRAHHAKVKESEMSVTLVEQSCEEAKKTIDDLKLQCHQETSNVAAKHDEIAKLHVKITGLEKVNADYKSKINRTQQSQKQLQQRLAEQRTRSGFLTSVGKKSEVDSSENEIPPTPLDQLPSQSSESRGVSVHRTPSSVRRSSRLSLRKEAVVDGCASVKRPMSDGQNSCGRRKVMRIDNSNLEGLPHKIVQGLNNIPEGNESPGIIRRPTTPMKVHRPPDISIASRRPLGVIDPNSPVQAGVSVEKKTALTRRTLRRATKEDANECKTQ